MSTAPTTAQGVQKLTPELKAFIAEWKEKPGNLIMILLALLAIIIAFQLMTNGTLL
ncbi:MAG: hypothetical protein GX748_19665, partial [Lentisphaerae bacterium]|nr:hypothetical protein [Lentisphaerota bacterium]